MANDRKPLGEPAPQVSNLALAIVILVVITIQTIFVCTGLVGSHTNGQNAWQDFSTGRTMASIAGMLPSDVDVLRDGRQTTMPAKDLVVGDLVYVTLGDKVGHMLVQNCQVLTGSSLPIYVLSRSRPTSV
jgi:sodium/potassium-transporting ATPase subunit alpha